MIRTTFEYEKRMTKQTAKELKYKRVMPDVMARIDNAKTGIELDRIMRTCREMM